MRNRAVRYATGQVTHVFGVALKVAVTLVALVVAFVILLRYFGVPVPTAEQVLQDAGRIL